MTKAHLIEQISDQLQQQLNTLLHASEQAHQSATHSESKAENKYDTLGLEAAYLAHGLSVQAQVLQQAITAWRHWQPAEFDATGVIALGALVMLEDDAGQSKTVLLAAQGGGLQGVIDQEPVTVVTAEAPLGMALLGKRLDDEVLLEIKGQRSHYVVVGLK